MTIWGPVPVLALLSKFEVALALRAKVFEHSTSDEMWEKELRQRQHIEQAVRVK
jgi:hypothetical protein